MKPSTGTTTSSKDNPPEGSGTSATPSGKEVSMADVDCRYEEMEQVTERGQIWALGQRNEAQIHALFPEIKHIPLWKL